MGIFSNIFAPPEIRNNLAEFKRPYTGVFGLFGGMTADATLANNKTAFTISAFYNGVDQLSNDIAKLPKHIYKKEGKNRFIDANHPAQYLISSVPNNLMTSFDLWKILISSAIVKGNGYAEIKRNEQTSREEAFIFRNSDDVQVFVADNAIFYKYKGRTIDSANMIHIKGFGFDGVVGIGIITFAAQQLGIMLDGKKYQGDIYKDRGLGYGVIHSDLAVTAPNKKAIEEGFTKKMTAGNKFNVPMLDEGMKYQSISITPQEAEFLASDKNAVIEVCRWLNIAPHKLKHLENSTFTNIQHQSIEHVQDSVLPWIVRCEMELNRKLFVAEQQQTLYVKFNEKILLRGDLEARKNYYTAAIYSGFMSRNEVRAYEDLDPADGLDDMLQPLNMQTIEMALEVLKQQKKETNNPQ